MHKAGYVNILGKPNAGKSTLMNTLLGQKLSIISPKAQTTRHRILGILNLEDAQVVFSDTPGILDAKYQLHKKMMSSVMESLNDADIFLLVIDASDQNPIEDPENENFGRILTSLKSSRAPLVIALNKMDKVDQIPLSTIAASLQKEFPDAILTTVSATQLLNTDELLDQILLLLPESPPYFDKEDISDRSERFFVAESIREKILLHYQKEIPYSVEVVIETFQEKKDLTYIRAEILVMRDSQKGILIGKGGESLKRIGTEARADLEVFLGRKVFLELFVKVRKNWRNDEDALKRLGY